MNDKLNELFTICGINDFIFTYQKEGEENYINYSIDEKTIVLNISNVEDVELDNLLESKINELKDLAIMGKTKTKSKSKKVMTGGRKKNKKINKHSRKVRHHRK